MLDWARSQQDRFDPVGDICRDLVADFDADCLTMKVWDHGGWHGIESHVITKHHPTLPVLHALDLAKVAYMSGGDNC